jgi:hypothetical protein
MTLVLDGPTGRQSASNVFKVETWQMPPFPYREMQGTKVRVSGPAIRLRLDDGSSLYVLKTRLNSDPDPMNFAGSAYSPTLPEIHQGSWRSIAEAIARQVAPVKLNVSAYPTIIVIPPSGVKDTQIIDPAGFQVGASGVYRVRSITVQITHDQVTPERDIPWPSQELRNQELPFCDSWVSTNYVCYIDRVHFGESK